MTDLPLDIEGPEGRSISFNRERWAHIVSHHGELSGMEKEVVETIDSPDTVKQGSMEDTFHYFREEEHLDYNQYICVVVNVEKGFVVTAYPTSNTEV